MYRNHYTVKLSAGHIYPIVSFHGFALPPAGLFLSDVADTGGVCWRGLWVNVCLSGPAGKKGEKTFGANLRNAKLKVIHVVIMNTFIVSVHLEMEATVPSGFQDVFYTVQISNALKNTCDQI